MLFMNRQNVELSEEGKQLKNLKMILDPWRVAIISLKSVMLWEKVWHPFAIVGVVSIAFLTFSITCDQHVYTMCLTLMIILNSFDFLMYILTKVYSELNAWTGHDEKEYENICISILQQYIRFKRYCHQFLKMREENSAMFYMIFTGILFSLAWLTVNLSPMVMVYITSLAVLLWPGYNQRRICALDGRQSS